MAECTQCGRAYDPSLGTGDFCPECADQIRASLGAGAQWNKIRTALMPSWEALGRAAGPKPVVTLVFCAFVVAGYFLPSGYLWLKPSEVFDGRWWQLLTSVFSHVNLTHLLANLIGLFVLGFWLENLLGRANLLVLWLLSGLASSVGGLLMPHSTGVQLGASGLVYGSLGILVVLYYFRRVKLPQPRRKHLLVLGVLAVFSAVIAVNLLMWMFYFYSYAYVHGAHAGGFAAGLLLGGLLPTAEVPSPRRTWSLAAIGIALAACAVPIGHYLKGPEVELDRITSDPEKLLNLAIGQADYATTIKLEEIISRRPDLARAHFLLAQVYMNQDRMDAAIQEYKTALTLAPQYHEARDRLGTALFYAGRYEEAAEQYKLYLASGPQTFASRSMARLGLAQAYYCLGRLDDAVREYQTLQIEEPNRRVSELKDLDRFRAGEKLSEFTLLPDCASRVHSIRK